ncbi:MAG: acyl carrier protein [Bauldia sp.]|nr:acyl carrier protein [Bauldia sp.]
MPNTEIESRIRQFIDENFIFSEDDANLDGSTSLLEAGLVDSTGILELVTFLESDFAIQVADAEIVPENLDSIDAIVAYVAGKLGNAASVAA